jgi:hypothetical protein
MCTLHAVIVLWVLVPTSGELFLSTKGVYSRPSQLFINKIVYIRELSVCCLVSSVFCCYQPLYVFWILCARFFVPDRFFFLGVGICGPEPEIGCPFPKKLQVKEIQKGLDDWNLSLR